MSEQCALEILENNDMIEIEKKKWTHQIAEEQYPFETDIIKILEIPFKSIRIKEKGEKFDERFRELMQENGYLCTPNSRYGSSDIFIKKEDVVNFLKKLPQEEIIFTENLHYLIRDYIENKYYNIELIQEKQYTGHGLHAFKGASVTSKIINLTEKRRRIEQQQNKEEKAIKFMEQLF